VKRTNFLATALLAGLSTAAFAQVKINEVMATGVGTDSQEFIELQGPANFDLSNYWLEFVNGNGGGTYRLFDLAGKSIPADGYCVLAGGNTVPNADYPNMGPATDWIQNGDPDSIRLTEKVTSNTIDAVTYFANYSTTPGSPALLNAPTTCVETLPTGLGGDDSFNVQTGTAASVAQTENTFGRFPDGADSNNNYNDFVNLHGGRTPGAPNVSVYSLTLPFTENFGAAGLTRKWGRFFTDVIRETVGGTPVPASVPNSPDPVSPTTFASIKDNTGGGEENGIVDFLGQDYYVEGYFYCGPISASTGGVELGALMGRRSVFQNNITTNAYPFTPITPANPNGTPGGTYGDSFYAIEASYTTGTIQAVKMDKTVRSVLFTTPAVSAGWHKLALNMFGGTIEYKVDGATVFTLTGETPRYGMVSVGYRETVTGVGSVRNNFDAINVTSPVASVNQWSLY